MLRTKLVIAFVALLSPSVIMGVMLYWGPRQIEQRLERSFLAHDELQLYLELALAAYRDLQRFSYEIMLGQAVSQEDLLESQRRMGAKLAELRRLTLEELAFVGTSEPEEREELARIERFGQLIDERVAALAESGTAEDRESFRERMGLLDQTLGGLIDEVIADETGEADAADRQTRALTERLTMFAIGVVVVSIVCAAITAWWARERIQAPIDALREGTRRLASDGLDHRVQVSGRDELAQLALSFNWMAAELERRRAELDRARFELEDKVRRRTRELQESNRMLRRMDQARRGMFADISHALKTPLTVIRGEAEVTLRAGRADGSRAALERIVETTAQLNKLVENLLLVARTDAATPQAQTIMLAAGALVRDVGEDARALASIKGIRVACSVPQEPIQIRGDPDQLRQALLILVDNACRYTPSDGQITIMLVAQPGHAVLTVGDTGVGIPSDELDLVADRFYRGSNAADLAPGGSGLGLDIATSIIEAHGGTIAVESEHGRGTLVTVSLPLWEGRDAADERAAG